MPTFSGVFISTARASRRHGGDRSCAGVCNLDPSRSQPSWSPQTAGGWLQQRPCRLRKFHCQQARSPSSTFSSAPGVRCVTRSLVFQARTTKSDTVGSWDDKRSTAQRSRVWSACRKMHARLHIAVPAILSRFELARTINARTDTHS